MLSICSSVCLSVCLCVCRQNAKTQFSQKLSNLELRSLLTTYRKYVIGLFKEPIMTIGSLKSKMAEIRYLENRHDVIFNAEGGPIWIKFQRLMQNDMSSAVMWSKSKPDLEFRYGGFWANSMACHPRATYHIARCCHLVNLLSRFQSHMSHCRVQSFGEISVMIVPHCRV